MEKPTKFLIIAVIALSCFTVLILYNFNLLNLGQTDDQNEPVYDLTLIVDYSNGTIKKIDSFTLDTSRNSVFDALQKYCQVEYTEYSNGDIFVDSLDGLTNTPEKYWQYWVNDEYAKVAASSYILNNSDVIKWVYLDL